MLVVFSVGRCELLMLSHSVTPVQVCLQHCCKQTVGTSNCARTAVAADRRCGRCHSRALRQPGLASKLLLLLLIANHSVHVTSAATRFTVVFALAG
jgi:hypothetical protein